MSSASLRRRLSRLSPSIREIDIELPSNRSVKQLMRQGLEELGLEEPKPKSHWLKYLLVLVVVTAIAYLVLYMWNPTWVQKVNEQNVMVNDTMKTLGFSLLIGVLALIITWLMYRNK